MLTFLWTFSSNSNYFKGFFDLNSFRVFQRSLRHSVKSSSKLQLSSPRPNLYILFAPFFYRRVSKSIPVLLKCSYCVLPRPKIPKLILSQEISPPSSYSFPLRTFKNLIVFSGGSPSPVLASRNMETSLMDCVGETVHGSGLT